MVKRSGWLIKQDEKMEDMSAKMQMTTRQFMIDTLQMTIHETEGWGYDRIVRLTEAWEKNRREYHAVLDTRDPLCDVKQEHMQRVFRDICKNRGEVIPFGERYPYLKEVRYDKRSKK